MGKIGFRIRSSVSAQVPVYVYVYRVSITKNEYVAVSNRAVYRARSNQASEAYGLDWSFFKYDQKFDAVL